MNRSIRGLTLCAALFAVACSDVAGPESPATLSLSVTSGSTAASAAAFIGSRGAARSETYDDGNHELVMDRVALVVREIELERLFSDDCDDLIDDDACEEFEAGPFLLELPLDGSVDPVINVVVEPDTYDELEFEIHKPGNDTPEERAFVLANPDFDDVSIRVEGTWDGAAFVFTQDMNAEQEIEFAEPLVVGDTGEPMNLTLSLDVSGWFVDENGALIDPTTANKGGENEELVEENIEASIEVFQDNDRDGNDDDDDDDDGSAGS